MSKPVFRAKVLTVSDGVVAGIREDTSGTALADALTAHGADVVEQRVCSDGEEVVADVLIELSRDFSGLIVTTGGTGFAPRDQTPEGTRKVIEREAPGLAEAMRLVNPLGRLSRGVAGTRGQTVIVNTPGSPRGCVEQLLAIIDVLPHAVALLADQSTQH
jgi:molybdopterin adenylyltransferase